MEPVWPSSWWNKKDGRTKVSWRCREGFNVARVAEQFGGGGHDLAAGAMISGERAQVEQTVLAATRAALEAAETSMKDFGLILADKPVGPTSHRVVHRVRQGTGIRKVGHAGTLDPRASGLLVLCLGAATRLSEYISTSSKCYEAVVRFGAATRTYDGDGEVVSRSTEIPSRCAGGCRASGVRR